MPKLYEISSGKSLDEYKSAMEEMRKLDLVFVGRLEYNQNWCMYVGNKAKKYTDVALLHVTPPGWMFKKGILFKYKKFKPYPTTILELSVLMTEKAKLFEITEEI